MEMQWQLVVECWADESSLGILDVEFPIAHSISLQSFPRSYKLINTFFFIFPWIDWREIEWDCNHFLLGLHSFILIFKFSLFPKLYCYIFYFLAQSTTLLITLLPSATRCLKKLIWKYLETIVESIFNDCYGNDYRLQTKSDCPAQKANMNSKLLLG